MRRFLDGFRPNSAILALCALAGCSDDGEAEAPSAAPPPAPMVVVADIGTGTVPVRVDLVARTEAVETVAIKARVEALLESMEFQEGGRVTKGQMLYRLDHRTYNADAEAAEAQVAQAEANVKLAREQVSVRAAEAGLTRARAELKKAKQDVARLRPLAEKDAVPRQDLDTALAAEEVAEAEVTASEATLTNSKIQEEVGILLAEAELKKADAALVLAQLDLEYCTIESPLDGLIGRTEVSVGNLVGRGEATQLATVSSIDPIYVTFAISEAEYLQLEEAARERGADQRASAELILADDSTYPHTGTIVTAERAVAVETGTLQIVAEFPNPDGFLRPGQFGRARIAVETIENAVLVPQRAIMEQQGAKVVLVVGADDKVALRTIQTSLRYEEFFVVTKGLQAGDRVIVEGQLKARPGQPVTPTARPVSSEPGEKEN